MLKNADVFKQLGATWTYRCEPFNCKYFMFVSWRLHEGRTVKNGTALDGKSLRFSAARGAMNP